VDLNLFFALLGGLLVLAFVANRLVRFTGVPDVIILLLTGVLLGPILKIVNPEIFRGITHGFGSLALLLILFEGGLDLKLKEIVNHFASGFFLSLVCYLLSVAGVAVTCHWMLHFPWIQALLVGAVLGCVSSAIVLPVLQQISLREEVRIILLVEASLGDALAVLAVTTLLTVAAGGAASPKQIAWGLFSSLLLAIAAGVLAGMLWSYMLPLLSEQRFWHVLTFGAVLLVYAGIHELQGNNLVGVLVFGMTLANYRAVRKEIDDAASARTDWFSEVPIRGKTEAHTHGQMQTFHGELAFLIRTFFFVLLGTLVDFGGLRRNLVLALSCFAALLMARVLTVEAGRFAWRALTALEREIMIWLLPRGLITAVLALQVLDARGKDYNFLPDLAFAVILLSNIVLLGGTIRSRALPAIAAEESAIAPDVPVELEPAPEL
jgi:cell volume regulation protein A